jgi:type II secretory pathway component PulK
MRRSSHGFVLVCVLWVLAVLTIITIGFGRRAMLDMRAAAYNMNHAQAMMVARGAVQRGVVEVRNMAFHDAITPPEQRQGVYLGQEWAQPKNLMEEEYFILGANAEEEFEDDIIEYRIIDLERYININATPKDMLENIEPLSRSAKRHIWKRRTEGEHEDEPVALFHAAEELRYLRGVRDKDWFGEKGKPALRDMIHVKGANKININTASLEVLLCVPEVDEEIMKTIIGYRAGGDGEIGTSDDHGFRSIEDIPIVLEMEIDRETMGQLHTYCMTASRYFKITGTVTRQRQLVRAVCSAVVLVNGTNAALVEWREETIGS